MGEMRNEMMNTEHDVHTKSDSHTKDEGNVNHLEGATVFVAGLGVSGRSAVRILQNLGAKVLTYDERNQGADVHSPDDIDLGGVDLVVTSPAFNPRTPFILEATKRHIPVISEVELAWDCRVNRRSTDTSAPWIGITGTNGKTSTTQMVSAMLQHGGNQAPAVGNIGTPVSGAAVDPDNDALCVELSSFQLHFTEHMTLDCAVITNIAADHLDWHGGMERYAADKAKVFRGVKRALVYNADDERVSALARAAQVAPGCRRIGFTMHAPKSGELGLQDGWIVDNSGIAGADAGTPQRIAAISSFTHLSEPDGTIYPHLLADALAALALVLGLGAALEPSLQALREFSPGGHRIETVATLNMRDGGVIRFVDDSKATNAHAASASLSSYRKKSVIWIAGGLAKGARFEQLIAHERQSIKAAVIIGVDQRLMLDAFASQAPDIALSVIDPGDSATVMDRAVQAAGTYAQAGDVILMAPACASMDQFVSYADRGDRFASCARRWVADYGKR
jgi:UDP-N-acetylmuramoylalanine--D-glutamate ligase